MFLNTALKGIIYATVSPCKLGAIDGRLRNFTQVTLHPSSWHVLKPETAKRNDRNKTNKTNETTVTAVMTTTKRLQRSSSWNYYLTLILSFYDGTPAILNTKVYTERRGRNRYRYSLTTSISVIFAIDSF